MRTKSSARKAGLAARDALDGGARRLAEEKIRSAILDLEEYKRARTIYCYSSVKGEVGTSMIIESALESGKRVFLPKVVSREKMVFIEIGQGSRMEPGAFGIPEPVGEASDIIPDMVILPCSAVDTFGNRTGYGGGYYDRFLADILGKGYDGAAKDLAAKTCAAKGLPAKICTTKVCVAFECQVFDEIEIEDTDIRADIIVTQERVIRI